MKTRVIFPLFNGLVCAILGALIGYYVARPMAGIWLGGLVGLSLGLAVELLLGRLGLSHWLYRRRVLLLILLEIPITIFLFGPYAYVIVETQPNPRPISCETPLAYGAKQYETVQIRTEDGIILAGWYVPPRQTPGPVVVVLHGARGNRCGATWHARQLIQAGYGVLLYDQRALGESTGEQLSFAWLDGPDLLAAVDYLAARPEVAAECIGAVGLSGGAHVALNAAYLGPDRLAALWLDGLQSQRIADFPSAENVGERFATLINFLILRMAEIHLGRPAPPPFVEILAELDHPPLVIIAGERDDFEYRVSQNYQAVAGANVQVWQIEGAWHLGGPKVIPDEYRQRMLAFFETTVGCQDRLGLGRSDEHQKVRYEPFVSNHSVSSR